MKQQLRVYRTVVIRWITEVFQLRAG